MTDLSDGSRRLNYKVLRGLRAGRVVVDDRRTGKTLTLLTHIAVTESCSERVHPIVVCEREESWRLLQKIWCDSFPDIPEPRWMSYRVFLRADGLWGPVFVDEPREHWNIPHLVQHAAGCGRFGGGVSSYYFTACLVPKLR